MARTRGRIVYWRSLGAAVLMAVALNAARGPVVSANHAAPPHLPWLAEAAYVVPRYPPGYGISHGAPRHPRVVLAAATSQPLVALTFDLDMSPQMAAALRSGAVPAWINQDALAALEESGTRATLFMTGMWAELYPDLARQLASRPQFEIGNHSYSHPAFHLPCYRLAGLGQGGAALEILRSQEILERLTGVRPRYFRFPGGCYDPAALDAVHAAGMIPVQWSVVSADAFNRNAQQIAATVLGGVGPGSIVVMHLMGGPNAPATGAALRTIIPTLITRGYRLVTVGQLLESGAAIEPTDPREVVEALPSPIPPCRWAPAGAACR